VTVANAYLVESKLRNGPGQQILDGDGAALGAGGWAQRARKGARPV
jgi:hypothetical protein